MFNKYCHVRIHHIILEIPINFTFHRDISHIIKRAFEKKDIKALQSFLTQIFCYKLRSKEFQITSRCLQFSDLEKKNEKPNFLPVWRMLICVQNHLKIYLQNFFFFFCGILQNVFTVNFMHNIANLKILSKMFSLKYIWCIIIYFPKK